MAGLSFARRTISAIGGKAVVFGKARIGLQIATNGLSTRRLQATPKVRNRPESAVQGRSRERRLLDRKAAIQWPRSVGQLIARTGHFRETDQDTLLNRTTGEP